MTPADERPEWICRCHGQLVCPVSASDERVAGAPGSEKQEKDLGSRMDTKGLAVDSLTAPNELDLEPFKRRIYQLKLDGGAHITASRDETLVGTDWKHDDGPDIECVHCDDIFGECNALQELVSEIERLRAAGSRVPPPDELIRRVFTGDGAQLENLDFSDDEWRALCADPEHFEITLRLDDWLEMGRIARAGLRAPSPPAADIEQAFRAGYHCRWHKDTGTYNFDPEMSPGDPDGAYAAWRAAVVAAQEPKG